MAGNNAFQIKKRRQIELVAMMHSVAVSLSPEQKRFVRPYANLTALRKYFNGRLKPGQTVALEISQGLLEAVRERGFRRRLKVMAALPDPPYDVLGPASFAVGLVKYLDSAGAKIIPLATMAENRAELQSLRDERYAKRIARLAETGKKPDFVLIGASHGRSVQSLLRKKGYFANIAFKTGLPEEAMESLLAKSAREREMERLARLKSRLQKKQRNLKEGRLTPKRPRLPK
ncbi:MAG: hypothetical protein NT067_04790 [Candidatus Diapherotrites archaeon]|nr:hypothetical protein [Candidatus Diapherotrites archaeon]